MKIAPTSDIAICGVHAPANEPFETDKVTAESLIAQGLAVRVSTPAADAPQPAVETAAAAPVVETAAVAPAPAKKRRA